MSLEQKKMAADKTTGVTFGMRPGLELLNEFSPVYLLFLIGSYQ
jgi:hypothetical protein